MVKVYFKDGNFKEFDDNIPLIDIAKSISPSLAKRCVVAKVNDNLLDLLTRLSSIEVSLEFIEETNNQAIDILNHSAAHLMAHAVKKLYKDVKFSIGPSIEEGFYYDFKLPMTLTPFDLEKIESEMKKIVKENIQLKRSVISKKEALDLFKDDEFKEELINDVTGEEVTLYTQGDFYDVCRGPHVISTGLIKNFKLLSIAGAYFKGSSENEMLTRIYGTAFFTKEALDEHLVNLEERKKRDHRKLGKELGLFMMSDYGPGFPFWLPHGMTLRKTLEDFWYDIHKKAGYKFIQTPIMLNKDLWEVSGHWFNYKENMYTSVIDEKEFAIKPMNCPGSMLVYQNDIHSYKNFPLRVAELGLVHRYEASGALAGLFRVRNFTQDDAHIFLTKEQIKDEIASVILLYKKVYDVFNLKFHIELSTRPEDKYIGNINVWDESEEALKEACIKASMDFKINEGDGAFYGPKLDFKLKDSMNRIWQCGTIQLDMNLPKRFNLSYVSEDGTKKEPVMIHRALFGSVERFIGILIEHYAGAFPTWLSPVQVKIIPVNLNYHLDYSKKLDGLFNDNNIRFELDLREEKLGYKIREAQTRKIPYQLVIGDKEAGDNLVTYRQYGKEEQVTVTIEEFINIIKDHNTNLN